MAALVTRAGRFVKQPTGYRAFLPAPLPPDPPVMLNGPISALLSRADQAVGRLDGAIFTLPDPDLFVAIYILLTAWFHGPKTPLDDVIRGCRGTHHDATRPAKTEKWKPVFRMRYSEKDQKESGKRRQKKEPCR